MTKLADLVRNWKGGGEEVKSVALSSPRSLQWNDCDPFDFQGGTSEPADSIDSRGGKCEQIEAIDLQGAANGPVDSIDVQNGEHEPINTVNLQNFASSALLSTTLEPEPLSPIRPHNAAASSLQSTVSEFKSLNPIQLQNVAASALEPMSPKEEPSDPYTLPIYAPFFDPSKVESLSGIPYPASNSTSSPLHQECADKDWYDWYKANSIHTPTSYKALKGYCFPNPRSSNESAAKPAAPSKKAEFTDKKSLADPTPSKKRMAPEQLADGECAICGNPLLKRSRHRLTNQDWLCGSCYEWRSRRTPDLKALRPKRPKNGHVIPQRALDAYNLPFIPAAASKSKRSVKKELSEEDPAKKALSTEHAHSELPAAASKPSRPAKAKPSEEDLLKKASSTEHAPSDLPATPQAPTPEPLTPPPVATPTNNSSSTKAPALAGRACANCHKTEERDGCWHKQKDSAEYLCNACYIYTRRHDGEARPESLWNKEKRKMKQTGGDKEAAPKQS